MLLVNVTREPDRGEAVSMGIAFHQVVVIKSERRSQREVKMNIKEEMEMRRRFLHRLYELRREKPNEYPNGYEIGKELGLEEKEARTVMDSLAEAGKVRKLSAAIINIEPLGREQVEEDLLKSNEAEDKKMVYESEKTNPKKVYVVHGRNVKARDAMFDFLRSIDLEPLEWEEALRLTNETAPFPQQVLDRVFETVQAIIVLITGDDIARLRDEYITAKDQEYERKLTIQARPNVIFEAGLAFGRIPKKTIFVELEKEKTRPFSDTYGRLYVRLSNDVKSRKRLIDRLETAGCKTNIQAKEHWINAGDFEGVVDKNSTNLVQEESPEQRKLEFTDEQLFILALIVESEEKASYRLLSESFREQFPDAYTVDFKSVMSWLKRNELIKHSLSIGNHILYVATDEGVEYAKREKNRIKNYEKEIDKFIERSKIVKGF